ncbi:EI24 domain-containing protein [Sulfitobacter sp.]|uniref:EI24 domain-containing protein n=1 Tax=Sulfitobacter sp. TaxID=1903071 RepID=UPI003002054F
MKSTLVAGFLVAVAGPGFTDTVDRTIGGDVLRFGEAGSPIEATRDVLVVGATVSLDGAIAQDTHAAGFDIDVDATTGGDLYAMGFSVSLRGPVGGDLSASGFSVRTRSGAEVAGNARLAGGWVTIDGRVLGALVAAGGEVTLNSEVSGDVLLAGETLTFGPDARIGGTLTYSAPARLNIPERVVPADRVTFEPYQRREMMGGAHEMWSEWEYPVLPTFFSLLSGFLVTLGLFTVIGALFLTLAPKQVRHLRQHIEARPGMALLWGVIGLSILFGLVPVSALAVVGIPLVPIVLLGIVAFWTLGYVLGVYVLAMRVMRGLGSAEHPEIWMRLLALVIGVTIFALLNFIPVLGWMANFALVLLGVGGMTMALFKFLVGNVGPTMDVDMRPIERDPQ